MLEDSAEMPRLFNINVNLSYKIGLVEEMMRLLNSNLSVKYLCIIL